VTSPTSRLLRRIAAFALALSSATTALAGHADVSGLRDGAGYDRFIVRFAPATARGAAAVRQQALDAVGRGQGVRFAQVRRLAVGSDVVTIDRKLDKAATQALMQRLAHDPRVDFVEVDAVVRAFMVPNDPLYPNQWNLQDSAAGIRMPAAWDKSRGNGAVVAVLDSGITVHSDLSANVLPGYDFVSDVQNARDNDGRDANPTDPGFWCAGQVRWHGTHVAGIVAAVTDNALGVAGIAPEARVVPVRTIGACGGLASDLADAIVWARGGTVPGVPANPNPADVINISLGYTGNCWGSAVQAAITGAHDAGVVVVPAAGNDNVDAGTTTPGGCANVINVAASGYDGAPAWFSNWGGSIDLAAPAGDNIRGVVSTWGGDIYQTVVGGTSISAPHVAGVVALLQAYRPSTPDDVESLLRASARGFTGPCPNEEAHGFCGGAGILDATAAFLRLDTPTLAIADVATAEGNAGNGAMTFVAQLSRAAPWPVTFVVHTTSGSATESTDFVRVSDTTITIPAGQTSKNVVVSAIGDTAIENDETFQLKVGSVAGAFVTGDHATGTILNDDLPALSISDASLVEGNSGTSVATFTVALSQAGLVPVTFNVATTAGTAAAPADFVAVPSTALSIPAGQLSTQVSVTVNGDTTIEANETFFLDASGVVGATVADGRGQGTITNDDLPVLKVNDVAITEGDSGTKVATFVVMVSPSAATPVSFTVATSPGTATAASDFVAVPATVLSIPAGQASRTVSVTINGDTTIEGDETFFLDITNVVGATVADSQGQATISNDDVRTLSLGDVSVVEGNSGTRAVTFTATLSQANTVPVTYTVATANGTAVAPGDYTAVAATAQSIPAGQLSKTFTVTVPGDATVEGNEQFSLNLGSVVGATATDTQGIATILNDDGPTLSVNDVTVAEGNSGTSVANFTVSLSQAAAVPVSFTVGTTNITAASGSDYVAVPPTVRTIPAGQTSLAVAVTINGDTTVEASETFALDLSGASGASILDGRGLATITNDDVPTLSIDDVTVAEGNSGKMAATFTISLSAATSTNVTFNAMTGSAGSAQAPADFDAVATTALVIPAGQTSVVYTVMVNGDTVVEPNEVFGFNLSAPSGATFADNQGIGTILNDD